MGQADFAIEAFGATSDLDQGLAVPGIALLARLLGFTATPALHDDAVEALFAKIWLELLGVELDVAVPALVHDGMDAGLIEGEAAGRERVLATSQLESAVGSVSLETNDAVGYVGILIELVAVAIEEAEVDAGAFFDDIATRLGPEIVGESGAREREPQEENKKDNEGGNLAMHMRLLERNSRDGNTFWQGTSRTHGRRIRATVLVMAIYARPVDSRRRPKIHHLVPVMAFCLAAAGTGQASPLDLFGFGGRSPAMVGTGVATATDYDAVYLNPAGLADTPGKRITLGTMGGQMFLYRDDRRSDTDAISGLIIGGALDLPLGGVLRDRIGLGMGFHVPFSAINRARQPLPGVPVHALLESRTHVIAVQGAVGVKLSSRWRAGLGVLALAELGGTIDVTADGFGRFATVSEQQLLTRFAPVAGARYLRPEQNLQLGLTFRGTSRSDYDILVTNDLGDTLPITIPTVRIAGVSQYDPLTVAVEAAWQKQPALTLIAQLAYQRWSAYPAPTGNPVANGREPEEPGFHDIAVPRIAAEWRIDWGKTRIATRGGYSFFWSPAPEMDGRQSLLDNHRNIFALGLGLAWPETKLPFSIDAWAQLHHLIPRSHTKDPAAYGPDEELPFDTLDTGGVITVGGITLGVTL